MSLLSVKASTVAVLLAGFCVGVTAQWLYFGFANPSLWIPDLLTGWALIGSGVIAWQARPSSRVGVLLVAAGFAWYLPSLSAADAALLAGAGTSGLFLHRGLLMHALVTFASGRIGSRAESLMVSGCYTAVILNGIWRSWLLTLLTAIVLVLACRRRSTIVIGSERRRRRTALRLAVILSATVVTVTIGNLVITDNVPRYIGALLYSVAVVVTGAGLALELRTRRDEDPEITDLVVELGGEQSPSLRDSLARALGDPTMQVGYWSPPTRAFVDGNGDILDRQAATSNTATTTISDGAGAPLALIIHHPSLLDDPALAEAVEAATRLASANASLEAELRGRVMELEASRRRLVRAGDDEQRRLESRLRSGPEDRLTDLVSEFRSFRERSPTSQSTPLIENVEDALNDTLEELHALARGLHPRLLTEGGLRVALEALATRSTARVQLDIAADELPGEVEATVYFVCSEALANVAKHAAADHVGMTVSRLGRRILLVVEDDGIGGADPSIGTGLRNLDDRVGALGGTFRVMDIIPHGTRLVAELPLGDKR
jgi:signal transduction histidine kinase